MKKEIKQITIKDPSVGEITIHTEIDQKHNDLIGKFGDGGGIKGLKFFNGHVLKNEDETFSIMDLKLLQSENVNVGWHKTNGGSCNFVSLFMNKPFIEYNLVIYPNAVLSVVYKECEK